MFAVIKTGGKQYKVAANDELVIEKLDGEVGSELVFGDVLMLGDDGKVTVGEPVVAGASVTAEVLEQRKGDKVMVVKKPQRITYRRKRGHRQLETVVKITAILADGKKAAAKPAKKAEPKAEAAPKADAPKAEAPKAEAKKAEAPKAAPKAEAGAADDLKALKGVGPALEKKLVAAGVTSFKQIAEMTAEQIEAVEAEIGASGKFESQGWVEQAKDLAKGA